MGNRRNGGMKQSCGEAKAQVNILIFSCNVYWAIQLSLPLMLIFICGQLSFLNEQMVSLKSHVGFIRSFVTLGAHIVLAWCVRRLSIRLESKASLRQPCFWTMPQRDMPHITLLVAVRIPCSACFAFLMLFNFQCAEVDRPKCTLSAHTHMASNSIPSKRV